MLRLKLSSDAIQFGILIISVVCTLGAFMAWVDSRYAKASDLNTEIEERRELKMEIDALYLRQVPSSERVELKYHQKGK